MYLKSLKIHFNPRSREGSDARYAGRSPYMCYFNPRSREGSDGNPDFSGICSRHFNPRSREGSDGAGADDSSGKSNFNPRSREGSDQPSLSPLLFLSISIHAPAKGATSDRRRRYSRKEFQSTLPRRERRSLGLMGFWRIYFNPRSREGSDPLS